MRSLPIVLACVLAGCGASPPGPDEQVELGWLQLGRKSHSSGIRYTLSARFDTDGPVATELDTDQRNGARHPLPAGSYSITIRPNFSLWRDVAVARVQAPAELVSDPEQRFDITPGVSTLVAYAFAVEGETLAFDSN